MIIQAIGVVASLEFASGLWGGMKASEMDERSLKKYARAFEKNEVARQMVVEKEELLDKRLMNVIKKKKAIVNYSVPKFVEVYGKIQKLEIQISEDLPVLFKNLPENQNQVVSGLVMSYQKEFTNTELVCGLVNPFAGGIGGMIIKDSERFASAANNQMSAANLVYSQAETICATYDAIIERANRLAELLTQFNFLFLKVIENADIIIETKGLNIKNYSKKEKMVLMTCVNFAAAIADLFHVPVITKEGTLTEVSQKAIECGESYLLKMQKIIDEE